MCLTEPVPVEEDIIVPEHVEPLGDRGVVAGDVTPAGSNILISYSARR